MSEDRSSKRGRNKLKRRSLEEARGSGAQGGRLGLPCKGILPMLPGQAAVGVRRGRQRQGIWQELWEPGTRAPRSIVTG